MKVLGQWKLSERAWVRLEVTDEPLTATEFDKLEKYLALTREASFEETTLILVESDTKYEKDRHA
jgi:hypothetical protein